jgi:hypothetical protein
MDEIGIEDRRKYHDRISKEFDARIDWLVENGMTVDKWTVLWSGPQYRRYLGEIQTIVDEVADTYPDDLSSIVAFLESWANLAIERGREEHPDKAELFPKKS